MQQPLQHQQLTTAISSVSDSSTMNLPVINTSTTVSPSPILSSTNAAAANPSQLQARLSQPTLVQQQNQQTQPQLRYLLERGCNDPPALQSPPAGAVATAVGGATPPIGVMPSIVSSSVGGSGGLVTTITSQQLGAQQQLSSAQGVTTSRVWVPGITSTNCSTHCSSSKQRYSVVACIHHFNEFSRATIHP